MRWFIFLFFCAGIEALCLENPGKKAVSGENFVIRFFQTADSNP